MSSEPETNSPSVPHQRLRMPRRARMRTGREFQHAYSSGARARGPNFIVVAVPNGLSWSRLGLSVGKRIWKGAVQRNRVRRIFREAFRLERPALPPGFDLVLIPARPRLEPLLDDCRQQLLRQVESAARKLDRRAQAENREVGPSDSQDPKKSESTK